MSDDALRASGAWMGPASVTSVTGVRLFIGDVRPAVVEMLIALYDAHDRAEQAKVRRERQTGIEETDDAHAWVERVCVYAMRCATDAEIDAAMDGHAGLRYTA